MGIAAGRSGHTTDRNRDPESELDRGLVLIRNQLVDGQIARCCYCMAAAAAAATAEKSVSNETADWGGGRQMALTPARRPGLLY